MEVNPDMQTIFHKNKKMNFWHLCFAGLLTLVLAGCSPSTTHVVPRDTSEADLAAIRQIASDYIDGYYAGDVERIERSLYDFLSKRWIDDDRVDSTTKWDMIALTEGGGGKDYPGDKTTTITILDVYRNIAMVKCDSPEYVDYVQMGKVEGKWIIINVLWTEKKPE